MNLRGRNWPTSADEEVYWQKIRTAYMFADDEIYLNTGSVGVQPRRVFEKMIAILKDVDRSPIRNRAKHMHFARRRRPAATPKIPHGDRLFPLADRAGYFFRATQKTWNAYEDNSRKCLKFN